MGGKHTARKRIERIAPWIITAAILTVILYEYPIDKIASELKHGHWAQIIPFAFALVAVMLFSLPTWDYLVIRASFGKPRYRDLLRAKAAASLLLVLGYGFMQGGYGVWIARKADTTVRRTVGVVLYIVLSDLVAVFLVAGIAVWLNDDGLPARTRLVAGTLGPAVAGVLLAIGLFGPRLLRRWVKDPRTLTPWIRVSSATYLLSVIGRCGQIMFTVFVTWGAMRGFGIDVPLSAVASYLPLILLVGSMPINVAGLGAVQAAWLLFEPWAPGERILAFQFAWILFVSAFVMLRGLPFMRGVIREIKQGAELDPPVS